MQELQSTAIDCDTSLAFSGRCSRARPQLRKQVVDRASALAITIMVVAKQNPKRKSQPPQAIASSLYFKLEGDLQRMERSVDVFR